MKKEKIALKKSASEMLPEGGSKKGEKAYLTRDLP